MSSNKKISFTLIELLIVIVILGILAGAVLAVINPQQLINKSKDAKIKEMMQKMSLILSAEYIATGSDINFINFMASLSANASVCNPLGSFRIQNVPTNWVSATYCVAPGGFHFYNYSGQPICIATNGFTGRSYAINRLGVLKSAPYNAPPIGSGMQSMCADFDSSAWTIE